MKSLAQFSADLRRLPKVVAIKVAEAAAPVITELAKSTFDASETPEGAAWKLGKKGQKVTLRKSGRLVRDIRYVPIGSRLRVALGVDYARFQIGRRPVFPRQSGSLPPAYVEALQKVAVRIVREELGK